MLYYKQTFLGRKRSFVSQRWDFFNKRMAVGRKVQTAQYRYPVLQIAMKETGF
jgi:hypothetical protein